jgi:hypothetical protein
MPTWARVADLPMGPLPLTFCLVDHAKVYRGALPDLTDPATLGCLLALVREASGEPHAYVWPSKNGLWTVYANSGHHPRSLGLECDTEAEALVVALEAAP